MTKVVITKTPAGEYTGFYCMGHAGYARKRIFGSEPDILCSAISVLTINTINSLQELAHVQMTVVSREEEGFLKAEFQQSLSESANLLMDSMVFGLNNLSQQYSSQYLLVEIQEVEKC